MYTVVVGLRSACKIVMWGVDVGVGVGVWVGGWVGVLYNKNVFFCL